MTLKDAGVDEVLGNYVNPNEKVTPYTTTVSSSLNTLEKVSAPLVNTTCTDHMEYEGKYISKSKIKELIRIRKINPNIFSCALHNKDENSHKAEPSQLLHKIVENLNEPTSAIATPPFIFKPTLEAAKENLKVLKAHDCSLTAVLKASPYSPCSVGSELRSVQTLIKTFLSHPMWKHFREIVEIGAVYPMVSKGFGRRHPARKSYGS
jgi:hypothetical protein